MENDIPLTETSFRMNLKPMAKLCGVKVRLLMLAATLLMGVATKAAAPDGKAIFEANCQSCHKIDADLVGPALKGVHERRDEAWLIKWIRNSQAVVKSGDQYAVDLFNKWNQVQMTSFDLSDDEIKAVLAYIKESGSAAPAGGGSAASTDATTPLNMEAQEKSILDNKAFLYTIGGLGIVILALVLFIQFKLKQLLKEKIAKGEVDLNNVEDKGMKFKVTPLQRFGLIVLALVGGFIAWYAWSYSTIGNQQGYAPKQPIAYSHELHAGKYQIACTYCHTGAERGKSATIPSVNICMNCHNQIKKESPEIKKIWNAWENKKPIEWIRIHNLPDFAYFNHSQHYKVAGIQCQKCHGEIQTMKVVAQHAPLTMGWCINCHRETKINMDNGYYKQVHGNNPKFKAALTKGGITIGQMGGLECSKCHY
jgi:mono/diheme cytochrome c family protein